MLEESKKKGKRKNGDYKYKRKQYKKKISEKPTNL